MWHTAIMVQLLSGHAGLKVSWHEWAERIQGCANVEMKSQCSISFFSMRSMGWTKTTIQEALRDQRSDVSYALGGWSERMGRGTRKLIDGSKEQCKPNIRAISAIIQFVKVTEPLQPQILSGMEEE